MKIEIDDTGMVIHCRQKNWEEAAELGVHYRRHPPEGYKLIRDVVTRRTPTGSAVNLLLAFDYVDDRIAPLTEAEAHAIFGKIELPKGPKPPHLNNRPGGDKPGGSR